MLVRFASSVPALLCFIHMACAWDKMIPCALGSGTQNGCSYCHNNSAIEITPWRTATAKPHFDLAEAASKTGGGYDVWWDTPKPEHGCRILLFRSFTTDEGSIIQGLSGNVILSAGHGGCHYGHVGSGGISVGYCCGDEDCKIAGALPTSNKKRSYQSRTEHRSIYRRSAGWQNPNPYYQPPPSPNVTCSDPEPDGDTYTKAGAQQSDGEILNCNGGESCSSTPSVSVAVSDSLTNDESTTVTISDGIHIDITAGMMLIGPTMTVTAGYSQEWSNAVTEAMSQTRTDTVTKSIALSIGLVPGPSFNAWFTPTLECKKYKVTCNKTEHILEKCSPIVDRDKNPKGDHGTMTVG